MNADSYILAQPEDRMGISGALWKYADPDFRRTSLHQGARHQNQLDRAKLRRNVEWCSARLRGRRMHTDWIRLLPYYWEHVIFYCLLMR